MDPEGGEVEHISRLEDDLESLHLREERMGGESVV